MVYAICMHVRCPSHISNCRSRPFSFTHCCFRLCGVNTALPCPSDAEAVRQVTSQRKSAPRLLTALQAVANLQRSSKISNARSSTMNIAIYNFLRGMNGTIYGLMDLKCTDGPPIWSYFVDLTNTLHFMPDL